MTFLMPEILSTSDNMFALRATGAQRTALDGPKTLESVVAADFLGKQEYIDEWIVYWLETNQWSANQLPLCISESIICDFKLKKLYKEGCQCFGFARRCKLAQKALCCACKAMEHCRF